MIKMFSALMLALMIPAAAMAAELTPAERLQMMLPEVDDEPCIGDSSETDEAVNAGNEITEQEILALLNPTS